MDPRILMRIRNTVSKVDSTFLPESNNLTYRDHYIRYNIRFRKETKKLMNVKLYCMNLELQLFKKSSKYWNSLNWNWKLRIWTIMAINDLPEPSLPADIGWGSTTDIMHGCQTGHISHHPLHPTCRIHVLLKEPNCEIFNLLDSDDF